MGNPGKTSCDPRGFHLFPPVSMCFPVTKCAVYCLVSSAPQSLDFLLLQVSIVKMAAFLPSDPLEHLHLLLRTNISYLFMSFMCVSVLHLCVSVDHIHTWCLQCIGSTDGCEHPCGAWEPRSPARAASALNHH